ncbi:MAG: hypothetical protein GTN36_05345 [Candidatus Aenigmarchaeota archaeon]|nr:hypothetical protein [Candidatus Aenigmarchaeota archaeon]
MDTIINNNWWDYLGEETIFVHLVCENQTVCNLYNNNKLQDTLEKLVDNQNLDEYKTSAHNIVAFGESILYFFIKNGIRDELKNSVYQMIKCYIDHLNKDKKEKFINRILSRLEYNYYTNLTSYLHEINKELLAFIN